MRVFYCVTVRIWFFIFIPFNSRFLFLLSSRRSLVFIIGLFFFFVLLYRRIYIYNGYLLMDELYRAVEQFLPTASGGMGGGSVPGGPPGDFPSIPVISPNNEFGENGEAPDSSKSASSSGVPALPQDMAKRQALEQEIFSLPRLTSTLREAREIYPQISPEAYPPERVFREIIAQKLGSDAAVRGMGAAPTQREIRAYTLWLSRIKKGSECDQICFPQPARHPIDIKLDIIPFFRDLAGRVE